MWTPIFKPSAKSLLNSDEKFNPKYVFKFLSILRVEIFLATILTGYVVISPSLKKFLCHPLPVFLGKISFGLYLAHFPIICALAYPTYNTFLAIVPQPVAAICSSLMLIIISLGAGWGMWYLADRPAIAFSRYIAKFLNGNIVKPPLISDSNWQQKPANIKLWLKKTDLVRLNWYPGPVPSSQNYWPIWFTSFPLVRYPYIFSPTSLACWHICSYGVSATSTKPIW